MPVVSEGIRVAVEGPLDEEALRSATACAREGAILEIDVLRLMR